MKIIIIGGTLDSANMGVRALTKGTIEAFKNIFNDAEISIFDYAKNPVNFKLWLGKHEVRIELINIRFSKKLYLKNNIALLIILALFVRILYFDNIKNYIIKRNVYLNKICNADLVVSIAGGDSFSDIYGVGRFAYVALPQILAIIMKKDIFHTPQTFGPFDRFYIKSIASYIVRNSKYLYSRDQEGIKEIRKLVGENEKKMEISFCYDVGFILDPRKPDQLDIEGWVQNSQRLVGFNISGLLYMGGYKKNNMFGLKLDYRTLVDAIIEHFILYKSSNILLIPHVFGFQGETDQTICEKVYNNLKDKFPNNINYVKGNYNENEIKYIIGMTEFFIGSRMHACIAALSQNIPSVAIAYSRKFLGVMGSIGMEDLVIDPRELDEAAVIRGINHAFDARDKYREILLKEIPRVKETILNVFGQVRQPDPA